jgi:hypothetical protein
MLLKDGEAELGPAALGGRRSGYRRVRRRVRLVRGNAENKPASARSRPGAYPFPEP